MEEEIDPFDFLLAESLHMTIAEMQDRMSNAEYVAWRAFYVYRNAQEEMALKARK
jgi:hypothetical protein